MIDLTKDERIIVFAFGSESLKDTVGRLGIVTSCITELKTRKAMVKLHDRLGQFIVDQNTDWFSEYFQKLRMEMEDDFENYENRITAILTMANFKFAS